MPKKRGRKTLYDFTRLKKVKTVFIPFEVGKMDSCRRAAYGYAEYNGFTIETKTVKGELRVTRLK